MAEYLLGSLADADEFVPPERALKMLVARVLNANSIAPRAIREAVIRNAVSGSEIAEEGASGIGTMNAFVEQVKAAAEACPLGRYGDRRMFISHLIRSYQQTFPMVDPSRFKQQLLQAHRERWLTLARADLQEAMDPVDIAESEVRHMDARFHFLILE